MAFLSSVMGDINDPDNIYDHEFQLEHELMVHYQGQQCPHCDEGSLDYHHRDLSEALMYFKCYKCGGMLIEIMDWL